MNRLFLVAAPAIFLAGPAFAGEEIRYASTPAWVDHHEIDEKMFEDGPSALVYDWQYRLEGGTVTSFTETAVRMDNPDALMEQGTITLSWMPDKGSLTVHRVEILRGGKAINVLAGGAEFTVLRREQGLESRLLNGKLTATLAVPDLQIGDVLHVASSTTLHDQALDEEMQVTQYLPAEPWQVGYARTMVSWPKDAQVHWRVGDPAELAAPWIEDGYRWIEAELPLAKRADMPADAPWRFRRPAILRVGTYADWQDLSRSMAPHYLKAMQIDAEGELAGEAAAIMKATADPLERAARALRLVQDDISYLLDGLDGGNYLPQTAEETWAKRFGDCKAKSVLLAAILRQMGIDAVPVLVTTTGGDALPELLPLPADFNHMIVRARIDGVDYWLDGTSTGTRMRNIGRVPAFYYGLPLTAEGADLVAMTQREPANPGIVTHIVADYSAGIDLPYTFDAKVRLFGAMGAPMEALADADNPAQLRALAASVASSFENGGVVSSVSVEYDEEAAAALITVHGVADSEFTWDDGRLAADNRTTSGEIKFGATRARPEWRDIPVLTPGPARSRVEVVIILPRDAKDFTYEGKSDFDFGYANTRIVGTTRLEGNRMVGKADIIQSLGEIAAAKLPEVKRALNRINSSDDRLLAPEDVNWRWESDPDDLHERAEPVIAAYSAAIEFADKGDYGPLAKRAAFFTRIFDWESALADYDALVADLGTAQTYLGRAQVLLSLGRRKDAIADIQSAYDLQPDNATAFWLARQLAYAGLQQKALALLESLPIGEDDEVIYADSKATVSGLNGNIQTGLELLAQQIAENPNNASLLNSDCWFRGLFKVALDHAVERCTKAVERADNLAAVLDSRAMVRYRLGQYDMALDDLNAALAIAPGLAPSRYLRGVVRLAQGQDSGLEDIEMALRMEPQIAERYARHGVKPGG